MRLVSSSRRVVLAGCRFTSIEQIAHGLADPLRLLSCGRRTSPAWERTLRATIMCSFGLLSAAEQQLFERLAVFAGGWILDAAEQVTKLPRTRGW